MEPIAISQLLESSTKAQSNEEIEHYTEQILMFISNSESVPILFQILTNPKLYQRGAITYMRKALSKHWANLSFEDRDKLRGDCMNFMISGNCTKELMETFYESVINFIYGNDETEWPQLLEYINHLYQKGDYENACSLVISIITEMKSEKIDESLMFLMELSAAAIQSNDIKTAVKGVFLYHTLLMVSDTKPNSEAHINAILCLISLAASNLDSSSITIIFDTFYDLFEFDYIPEGLYEQIIDIIIQFGLNQELQPNDRLIVTRSITPIITKLPIQVVSKILDVSFNAISDLIEFDQKFPTDQFEEFKRCAYEIDHEVIYPVLQEKISMAFQSNSPYHQTTALLLFAVLIRLIPDLSYKDIETIINYIEIAITSNIDLFKQAGFYVIKQFEDAFNSIGAYCAKLVPSILQNLISKNPEICSDAFEAFSSIIEFADTEYPGLLGEYLSLTDKIPEEQITYYLSLLPSVIESCEEISDDDMDNIINFISQFMESDSNLDYKASALQTAIAILHKDETQIDFVTSVFFPVLQQCLNSDKIIHLNESLYFLGNIATFLRNDVLKYIKDYIPRVLELTQLPMNNDDNCSTLADCALNLAKITKFAGEYVQEYLKVLIPLFKKGIDSGNEEFSKKVIVAIKFVAKFLSSKDSSEFFNNFYKIISEDDDIDIICAIFETLKKLLKSVSQENLNEFIDISIKIIMGFISGELPVLNSKPLIDSPISTIFVQYFCGFLNQFYTHQTSINDDLCKYLLQWFNKDNELELFEITGTLTCCIENRTVSQELFQVILETVMTKVGIATEPGLIQNLAFMLNLLVQIEGNLVSDVIKMLPLIEEWRKLACKTKFGFQLTISNISSLYLTLASRTQIDEDLIIFAIKEFPPYDELETNNMAQNILIIVNKYNSQRINETLALSLSRLVISDEKKLEKYKITSDNFNALVQLFKKLVSNESLLSLVYSSIGKQRSKLRKLQAILH